jgi:hypothetical protein
MVQNQQIVIIVLQRIHHQAIVVRIQHLPILPHQFILAHEEVNIISIVMAIKLILEIKTQIQPVFC